MMKNTQLGEERAYPESGMMNFIVNYLNEDISLDFNPSDEFHIWGIEILPDRISWFVDGNELYTFYYDSD